MATRKKKLPAKKTTAANEPAAKAKLPAREAATSDDPRFAEIMTSFAKDRRVTSGKMMSSVGLKVNGKIFAMMVRGELVVKLPKPRVDALIASGNGKPFDPRRDGRIMKEWVTITGRPATWMSIAQEAFTFVSGA
jgi:TfoX/Sxy family transcriptional regulator of competence genes